VARDGFVEMGVLVKTALWVESQVELTRRQLEPKLRLKLGKAKTEWLELKSRSPNVSTMSGAELRLRASLLRADSRLRMMISELIGRIIVELEKVRRTPPRE
jgi:hypothetical protein